MNKIESKWGKYTDWDYLVEQCDNIKGLKTVEILSSKRAFQYLKKELGVDFLVNALDKKHPIMHDVFNEVAWTRQQFIWFAKALKSIKNQEKYDIFIERTKDPEKYMEALSVLVEAYRMQQSGFEITLDPVINHNIPDLKIKDKKTKDELYVEVSINITSTAKIEASETLTTIFNKIVNQYPFLSFCGKIFKTLSPQHLNEIADKVNTLVTTVRQSNHFQELLVRGVLELGIAPKDDIRTLQKWADDHMLKIGTLVGPPYNANEVVRVRRKIEYEQKQIPKQNPNLVVILNNDLFNYLQNVQLLMSEIEEEVYKYDHILFVIINGSHFGSGNVQRTMEGSHIYIERIRYGFIVEKHIILFNRYCKHSVMPATIDKIYKSYMDF